MPGKAATTVQEPLTGVGGYVGEVLTDSAGPTGSVTYSCGGCETRWPGVSRCHCSGCHNTFAGIDLFDRHRRLIKDVGICLDPATITSPKTGEREMYLTNGLWSSVAEPKPRGQHLRKRGEPTP